MNRQTHPRSADRDDHRRRRAPRRRPEHVRHAHPGHRRHRRAGRGHPRRPAATWSASPWTTRRTWRPWPRSARQTPRQPGRRPAGELPPGRAGRAPRRQAPLQPRPPLPPREARSRSREKVRFLADVAREHDCALRVGVNCGSVDPEIKARYPRRRRRGHGRARRSSTARMLDDLGFDRYVVSLKDSHPRKVIEANRASPPLRPDVPLHLGVTEAGIPPEGIIKTRVAFEQLLSPRHRRHPAREPHPAQPAQARGDRGRAGRSWPTSRPAASARCPSSTTTSSTSSPARRARASRTRSSWSSPRR